ncbi:hypothetical protein [Nocardia ignorata]
MAPEAAVEEELGGGYSPVSELFLWPPILTALDREELPLDDIALFARLVPVHELVDLFNEARTGRWQHHPAELVARFIELTVTEQMQTLIEQSLLYSPNSRPPRARRAPCTRPSSHAEPEQPTFSRGQYDVGSDPIGTDAIVALDADSATTRVNDVLTELTS